MANSPFLIYLGTVVEGLTIIENILICVVFLNVSKSHNHILFYRIISGTTLIGRGQAVDIFLDSNIRKGLISRAHAQIILKDGEDKKTIYEIFDSSLNGTYVNDVRINGSVVLKEGDTIAFGHLRGSLIKPGTLAPQKETEFLFKVNNSLMEFYDYYYTPNL